MEHLISGDVEGTHPRSEVDRSVCRVVSDVLDGARVVGVNRAHRGDDDEDHLHQEDRRRPLAGHLVDAFAGRRFFPAEHTWLGLGVGLGVGIGLGVGLG